MDPAALAEAMAEAHDAGLVPMAVVATAGTTDFGAVDPLAELAALARAYGAWFHIDAAYGGGLMVSNRYRHLLDGTRLADSVTVDFHKTFFQPVSSSALLVRDRAMLQHVTYYADYLNPESAALAEIPNQVDKSIQTTRRFDALKLWLTLRIMGADAIGALFDEAIDLAARVGSVLAADDDFELAAEPQLSTLVFRYRPRAGADGTPAFRGRGGRSQPGHPRRRLRFRQGRGGGHQGGRPALPEVHPPQRRGNPGGHQRDHRTAPPHRRAAAGRHSASTSEVSA